MPRANRTCSYAGACLNKPVRNGRCPEHQFERFGEPWERATEYGKRLSDSLIKYVLIRDEYKCWICLSHAVEVDHMIPRFKGGSDNLENLGAICVNCHKKKSSAEGQEALRMKREAQRIVSKD